MTLTPPGGEQAATPPWLPVLAGAWLLLALGGLVAAALAGPADLCRADEASARWAADPARGAGSLQPLTLPPPTGEQV